MCDVKSIEATATQAYHPCKKYGKVTLVLDVQTIEATLLQDYLPCKIW